jgi:hypothetical protein
MKGGQGSMRWLMWIILGWMLFCAAVMLVFIPVFPSIMKERAARDVKPAVVDTAFSAGEACGGPREEIPVERRKP